MGYDMVVFGFTRGEVRQMKKTDKIDSNIITYLIQYLILDMSYI